MDWKTFIVELLNSTGFVPLLTAMIMIYIFGIRKGSSKKAIQLEVEQINRSVKRRMLHYKWKGINDPLNRLPTGTFDQVFAEMVTTWSWNRKKQKCQLEELQEFYDKVKEVNRGLEEEGITTRVYEKLDHVRRGYYNLVRVGFIK